MNHDLKPGVEPVEGYILIERLGRGGFGEVWKATGPGGFHVALKFVMLGEDVGTVELRALEVIKHIRHPHLLGTNGSWQDEGQLIIAMELADRTLLDRFREAAGQGFPGIPAPEIFEHFIDAAKGLDYLNEPRHPTGGSGPQGIQHRDIKPQNLLLVGGSVKVADFGLARVLEHSTTGHTGSMTPSYAAPEFFNGKTSSQSDQYSLAITYCHLRGGRLPFEGIPAAVIAGHVMREPDLSMIPEVERAAVARALAKTPRDRWSSCRVFIQAVKDAAEGRATSPEVAMGDAPPTIDPAWSRLSTPQVTKVGTQPTTERIGNGPSSRSEFDAFSAAKLDSEFARPRGRQQSFYKLGAWALVGAVLLVAILLLLPRGQPAQVAASRTPDTGSPEVRDESTAKRLGGEVTEPAPTVVTKTPVGGAAKPSSTVAPVTEGPEKNTASARAHINRGHSFLAAEDAKQAFAEFEEAIRLDPRNAEGYAGRSFSTRGHRNQRLKDAEEAIRLDSRSAFAHAVRGVWLASGSNHDLPGALAECNEAVRLDPNSAFGYESRAFVHLRRYALEGQQESDLNSVLSECEVAIRLDPERARTYCHRGEAQRELGHLDQAMDDFNAALRLSPNYVMALNGRAQTWLAKREYSRAVADCDRAIKINPNIVNVYWTRRDCFTAMGNSARAKADDETSKRVQSGYDR